MQIALVADWLPVFAGAEQVIAEFHALFPSAPLFTTVANRSQLGPLADADIRTTALQKWYALTGNHQWLLPWMPRAMENMDLDGYDIILSSSHAVGKGIVPPPHAKHICYCHTPMRYAWEMEDEYLDDFRIPHIVRRSIKKRLTALRRWDMTTAKRVDTFIANSSTTQERIRRIYNRDSVVIHPPVSDRFFDVETPKMGIFTDDYYVSVGRLVPYKRIDLLVQAANKRKFRLKIAGTGKDFARLSAMAGPTVEMLGFVPSEDLPALYGGAKALLFAPLEDAGVVPLEAQASGKPVIAYGKGGVLDTVQDGTTGVFFPEQTMDAVCDSIDRFEGMSFDSSVIRNHARQYSATAFRSKILNEVSSL